MITICLLNPEYISAYIISAIFNKQTELSKKYNNIFKVALTDLLHRYLFEIKAAIFNCLECPFSRASLGILDEIWSEPTHERSAME